MVLEWCKRNDLVGYIVWNNVLIAKHEGENKSHKKSLCLQVVGGHAYFMKTSYSFCSNNTVRDVEPLSIKKLAAHTYRPSKGTLFKDWRPYIGFIIEPG